MVDSSPVGKKASGKIIVWAWMLAIAWTALVAGSLFWYYRLNREEIMVMGRSKALMAFDRDRLYRRWVSMQGGIYVPVSDKVLPNPLLAHVPERDIFTPSGKPLTLINAAYLARQVFESIDPQAEMVAGRGHMTSLNPIRPENRPDAWERAALLRFQQGAKEVSSIEIIDGRSYVRLMRVAITEKPCLRCHAVQGYRVGDIRGGVGVTVPISDLLAANRPQLLGAICGHGLIWMLGLGVIGLGSRKLSGTVAALQESETALRNQTVQLEHEVVDRHSAEMALRDSERFLSTIIDTEPECVKMLAADGGLLMMNAAGLAMIEAASLDEVKGKCVYPLIAEEHRDAFIAAVEEVFQGNQATLEFEVVGLKGRRRWLESRAVPFRNEAGNIVSLLSITSDVTERKRQEEELRELSLVDELTGLTNRRGFMLLARQQMKVADRNRMRLALVFADLDGLKSINDTFGHREGDRAIVDTAVILKSSFRASDIVARVGGDEFVALSLESAPDVVSVISKRLTENLHAHVLDAGGTYQLSFSFGVAVYDPEHPVLLETLLQQGDQLMYRQKRAKRETG
ncbi:diguanylate cyclase [Geomesophilobacter sediminis]|uniref:Diguanylate cyclase n=1 Tax=Geomesophilobacter sediminis TaxID=2798584 RepID=A0A8J7SA22_9BACT|nr:diguanylate cyclase [Geomesophilobacter sediminis]MBJ6727225.1 diguanylate cyclase [Geomesophilobacter sediminis]